MKSIIFHQKSTAQVKSNHLNMAVLSKKKKKKFMSYYLFHYNIISTSAHDCLIINSQKKL